MINQTAAKKQNGRKPEAKTASGARKKSGTRKAAASGAKKKTGKKSVQSAGKKTEAKKSSGDSGIPMTNEVGLIASFGAMCLLMISNFGYCGAAGSFLSDLLFGFFGCVQYVMPVAFFFGAVMLIANDYSALAMKKAGAEFLFLMMISAFAQIFYDKKEVAVNELFSLAMENHRTGGLIGGGIGLALKSGFGMAGAVVIVSCITLLSLVLLTQRSFVGFFRKWLRRTKAAASALSARLTKEKIVGAFRAFTREETKEAVSGETPESSEPEEEEEPTLLERTAATGKMSSRKKWKTRSERRREKKCEEKVRVLEEERERRDTAKPAASRTAGDGIRINMPVFTSSDEVGQKGSLRELHPEPYPFKPDAHAEEFTGSLDYSLFENAAPKKKSVFPEEISGDGSARKLFFGEPDGAAESAETIPEAETLPETAPDETISGLEETKEIEEIKERKEIEETENIEHTEAAGTVSPESAASEAEMPGRTAPTEDQTEAFATESRAGAVSAAKISQNISGERKNAAQTQPLAAGQVGTAAAQPSEAAVAKPEYQLPPLSLLHKGSQTFPDDMDRQLKQTAEKLQTTLEKYGVKVTITDISCGPAVTRYEMFPEQGVRVSKILSLADDIKLNLAAADIRIEAPIPGKAAVGIEVPNKKVMQVSFRQLAESRTFQSFPSKLAFAVGMDIGGNIMVADLAKMPHLLIAGATGSGKSVCINTLIMSILYKAKPDEVKLIMIDPKMVELSTYNGIPHLLIPVVTDPKKASGALSWAVSEMTQRYKKFSETGVRNIEGYNKKVAKILAGENANEEHLEKMPQIVIIIDELADLMMVASDEVEDAIVRLSQLARAAGIHLVIATQRPSVDVITGLIKANVPSRIAFAVSSKVDSRTIIDMNGAEKLLGKGDMLFHPAGYQKPVRVQGAFISDEEIAAVTDFLKEETAPEEIREASREIESRIQTTSVTKDRDEYFEAAARFIMEKDKATIGMLQRMFKIGFNRAARIIDQLAEAGIVGPEEGTKPRKILMSPEQLEEYFEESL